MWFGILNLRGALVLLALPLPRHRYHPEPLIMLLANQVLVQV